MVSILMCFQITSLSGIRQIDSPFFVFSLHLRYNSSLSNIALSADDSCVRSLLIHVQELFFREVLIGNELIEF